MEENSAGQGDEGDILEKERAVRQSDNGQLPNQPADKRPKPLPILELLMDDRELKSPVAKLLFSRGVRLIPKRLDVADFIISEQIAIERKTASDFESSIMDGRLFSQCKDLNLNFQFPLICIVGGDFGHLHRKAIIGAQISIATQFRIPIFQLDSEEELAEFIHILLIQRSKPQKDMKLRFEKKAISKDDQLQMVIEGVSMIGPVHAKNLLKRFKTIQKVFSASEKQMQKVEGIGEIRAKQIRRIATAVYGEEDKSQEKLNDDRNEQRDGA